jgi:formylglycine-generating enzyme required for sulfatase activity
MCLISFGSPRNFVMNIQARDRRALTPRGEMLHVQGGTFRMGCDKHYPEEAPAHRVTLDSFWINRTPVTNRAFCVFLKYGPHLCAPNCCRRYRPAARHH